MAAQNQNLLGLATNSSFQIPSLNIKLATTNYCLWRSTIISALETFDLESYVLDPKPPAETIIVEHENAAATTDPNPEFQIWKKRDRYVLLWLKSTLTERALAIVARSTTSQSAWNALEKTFQAQTKANRMAMKNQLQTLTKGSLTIMEYVEKKRAIADSLAENLTPVSTEDLIGHILNGLDSSYSSFKSAFILKDGDPTVDDLTGFLLQEEARLEQEHLSHTIPVPSASPTTAPMALQVTRPQRYHTGSPQPSRQFDPRRRRPHCQLCNKPGHEAVDCWQRSNLIDYPARKPNPRDRPVRQAHLAQHQSSYAHDPSWYSDSGATDHVAPDLKNMQISEPYHGHDKLQVGDDFAGSTAPPRGRS